ncbi:MAG TPA: UTP--glucose-1-phosphate uridylyltransferase [Syntrophorhabdaceae bacterium]|jgi:UDP-N-acetylglucosamine/UDP-N-acetylgalactosamine diphosphorylase
MTEEILVQMLRKYRQSSIFAHYASLSQEKKVVFLEESGQFDFDLAFSLYGDSLKTKAGAAGADSIDPAPILTIPRTAEGIARKEEALRAGETLLREGKVAVLIVAGGQGSRLGFEGPKGAFPISPIKGKTLFRLFCESLKAMSLLYGCPIPLVIMTSRENDLDTRKYFDSHRYFGLESGNVDFFQQGMLPTVTPEGEFLLKDETHFFTNPDGHGGSLKGIYDSGLLDRLMSRGVSELFYCQVDNPLVRMADPVFLGYHHLKGSEMSTKVVRRENIEEKVGVYVTVGGKEAIVEYSDLGGKHMEALDDKGNILYWGGNTAIHILSLEFVRRLNSHGFVLPYHRASRPVDAWKPEGGFERAEGWKFETFVFDAIPFAGKTCAIEVSREEEFSPVKNSEGPDSPRTASEAMNRLFRKWLEDSGVSVAPGARVEISPLFAVDRERLALKLAGEKIEITRDTYLGD